MIICDTKDLCIRSFSKSNEENAKEFAKLHNAEIFQNKNEETGKRFLEEIVDDSIIVKYLKTNELYITIYRYWENKKEFHITKAPIDCLNEKYIQFHSGTIEYKGSIILKENLNKIIECNKCEDDMKLNIFMEEDNDEFAKKLIQDYYNNKFLDIKKKISELEDVKKRYYDVAFNELTLTDY